MTLEPINCFVVHCDSCGVPLEGNGFFWCVPVGIGSLTGHAIAKVALPCGWTTDGYAQWYCADCPELFHSDVCDACLKGDHNACEGGSCVCSMNPDKFAASERVPPYDHAAGLVRTLAAAVLGIVGKAVHQGYGNAATSEEAG